MITLRPVRFDDADHLWRWSWEVPEPEWQRWDAPYFHGGQAPTRAAFDADHRARLASPHRRMIEQDGLPLGIVTRYEEEPSGGGWWELGVVIHDPAHWNGGRGRAALATWVELTLAETDAHVLTLTTWGGNERMIRCGEACGFTVCARIPEARLVDGRRFDSVKLARLRG